MNIPNDADGDAIRRVLSHGSDPSCPMDIDFMIACPDVSTAEKIAPLVSAQGYTIEIRVDSENDAVTCCCMRHMLLDYDLLMVAQAALDAVAQPCGGQIDGWGTFGNGPNATA